VPPCDRASTPFLTAPLRLLRLPRPPPQKLLAFEKFLEEHPEWRDKVLLVQIAVPSRTDVPEYQRLRR
jgi:trehalose-6-phosphate synthase